MRTPDQIEASRRRVRERLARREAWVRAVLQHYGDQVRTGRGVICLRQVREDGCWAGRIIHRPTDHYADTHECRSTLFHRDGVFSHAVHQTLRECLEELYTDGFQVVYPGWADVVFASREFIMGNLGAEAGRMFWEYVHLRREAHGWWTGDCS